MTSQSINMDDDAFAVNGGDVYAVKITDWEKDLYRNTGIIPKRTFETHTGDGSSQERLSVLFLQFGTVITLNERVI
jgi:hypothetical protein